MAHAVVSELPTINGLLAAAFVGIYGARLVMQAVLLRRRVKVAKGAAGEEAGDWGELLLVVLPKNLLVLAVPYLLVTRVEINAVFWFGWCVFVCAIGMRMFALRQLGEMYSLNVDIRGRHRLVQTGLFARMRHPLYFAYLADTAGIVLFLQSPMIAFILLPVTVGIVIRARNEEAALHNKFGAQYAEYAERVAGFNPLATYFRRQRRARFATLQAAR